MGSTVLCLCQCMRFLLVPTSVVPIDRLIGDLTIFSSNFDDLSPNF